MGVLLIWVTNSTVSVSGFASANLFKMSQTKLENTGIAITSGFQDIIHNLALVDHIKAFDSNDLAEVRNELLSPYLVPPPAATSFPRLDPANGDYPRHIRPDTRTVLHYSTLDALCFEHLYFVSDISILF